LSAPLSPFGNAKEDFTFWLKEYLSRKIVTLSSRASNNDQSKEISRCRLKMRESTTTIDDIDDLTKEISKNGFKSIRNYALPAISFVRFCLNERAIGEIMEISAAIVQEDYFGDKHFSSGATKKNHYRAVVSFINYIEKNNTIDEYGASYQFGMEKMPRSYEAKKIPDTLLPDEFERFVAFLDNSYMTKKAIDTHRNRLMIKLLCFMGIRVSELTGLTLKSFSSKDSEGYYPVKLIGKGNKERIVYLSGSKIDPDLSLWLGKFETQSSKLFAIKEAMVYIIVKEALLLCGFHKGKMGPHLLRHSYATYLLSKGVGLAQIQKLLGHESITTTTIYAKVIDKEIKDAARVF
jgi:integrase/recombinase XerD